MQDQKKQDKLIKKPQKFVPQEIKVADTDSLEAEIANLVNQSTSDRFLRPMFEQAPDDWPRACMFGCTCMPCRQGNCGACAVDGMRRLQGW